MTDITAAIGLIQLSRYPEMLRRRREIIGMYDRLLKPAGVEIMKHYTKEYTSSGHLYLTRIPGIRRKGEKCDDRLSGGTGHCDECAL